MQNSRVAGVILGLDKRFRLVGVRRDLVRRSRRFRLVSFRPLFPLPYSARIQLGSDNFCDALGAEGRAPGHYIPLSELSEGFSASSGRSERARHLGKLLSPGKSIKSSTLGAVSSWVSCGSCCVSVSSQRPRYGAARVGFLGSGLLCSQHSYAGQFLL